MHEWTAEVFATQGAVLSAQYRLMIRTDRQAVERKAEEGGGKYDDIEIDPYTDEQIAEITEAVITESRAPPRALSPAGGRTSRRATSCLRWSKDPCGSPTWWCGIPEWAWASMGSRRCGSGRSSASGCPVSSVPDDLNIPDVQQRVHWDPEWARRAGNPAVYDYGRMRETWLVHLCTDWMGDDAWLAALDVQFRRFNYVGDTHWMRGTVTRKYLSDEGAPAVDLDIYGENQRGEITCPGTRHHLVA